MNTGMLPIRNHLPTDSSLRILSVPCPLVNPPVLIAGTCFYFVACFNSFLACIFTVRAFAIFLFCSLVWMLLLQMLVRLESTMIALLMMDGLQKVICRFQALGAISLCATD